MAELIDGKKISQDLKDEVKEKVAELKAQGVEVTLAVILVGNDPASTVYVGNKYFMIKLMYVKNQDF
jgi:methylenetetrahydrofolate dehydrogenase (NADP+)/methenyltetrahydrofolate cyclohydrolase